MEERRTRPRIVAIGMKDRLWKRDREPMDKAVKWDFRDERQATGRDGGAMDETVKCGFGET